MAVKEAIQVPKRIGAYVILETIGEGGFGTVYKAKNPSNGETVAVKVLLRERLGNRVVVERFRQEYRSARALSHPNLVRAVDFGEEDSSLYLVMEYVDGVDLATRIEKQGKLPEDQAVAIISQIAEALQCAHDQCIVHRDVKPNNILITPQGVAKLADMGLAKDLHLDLDLTKPMAGLGTPNFMPPEQFNNAKNADPRYDIYSLGATLYMAVTGHLPFRARTNLQMMKLKMKNEVVPPRKIVPELSQAIDFGIRRALRADPAQRPSTCREFVATLKSTNAARRPKPVESDASSEASKPERQFERRATVRIPSTQQVACRPVARLRETNWSARLHDISPDGIRLNVRRRFEPGAHLIVELRERGQRLTTLMLVRVVRIARKNDGIYELGCVFASTINEAEMKSWL